MATPSWAHVIRVGSDDACLTTSCPPHDFDTLEPGSSPGSLPEHSGERDQTSVVERRPSSSHLRSQCCAMAARTVVSCPPHGSCQVHRRIFLTRNYRPRKSPRRSPRKPRTESHGVRSAHVRWCAGHSDARARESSSRNDSRASKFSGVEQTTCSTRARPRSGPACTSRP